MSTELIPQRLRDLARPTGTPAETGRPFEVAYDIDEAPNAVVLRAQLLAWARAAGIASGPVQLSDLMAVELGAGEPAVYVWDRDEAGELLTEDGGAPVYRRVVLTDADEDDAPDFLFGGRPRRRPQRRRR